MKQRRTEKKRENNNTPVSHLEGNTRVRHPLLLFYRNCKAELRLILLSLTEKYIEAETSIV